MKSDTYTRHRCEGRHTFIRTGEQKLGCDVMECVYCSLKVVDVVHEKPTPITASEFWRSLAAVAIWSSIITMWICYLVNGR